MSVRSFRRAHARRVTQAQSRPGRRGRLVAGLAVSGSLLLTPAALASTYQVMGTSDDATGVNCDAPTSTGGPFTCTTLRDAVYSADHDSSASTITFAPGVSGTITLTNGALDVTGPGPGLTVTGPGASALTVSGDGSGRVFDIAPTATGTPVTISGLTLTDGSAVAGGAIYATGNANLGLTDDKVQNSAATHGPGGGVFAYGALVISGSTISGNTATAIGGGVDAGGYNSPFVMSNSQVVGNMSGESGGGLFANADTSDVTGSTFSGNTAGAGGGGLTLDSAYGTAILSNLTVTGDHVTAGAGGGAIIETGYGTAKVIDSTFSGNGATEGAGLAAFERSGPIAIEGTTISGNASTGSAGHGGGAFLEADAQVAPQVIDSTITGNSAADGAGAVVRGAGYSAQGITSAVFDNSTIAANAASQHAGGVYLEQGHYSSQGYLSPNVELNSTIVAGNTAAGVGDDLERGGAATTGAIDANYSLVQAPGSVPLTNNHTLIGINPQLGPLQNNGGPTNTMLPSPTSPVIDQGKAAPDLTTDQRGDPRTVQTGIPNAPGGDGTDIGSVELAANQVYVPPTSAGTTLSIRGAGLGVSSSPLLVGSQTPVTCSVKVGVLHACVIEVRNSAGTLLGSGEVTSSGGASSLTTQVTTTTAGARYLKNRQLGTGATATLTASQTAAGSPTASGNVTYLAGPSITLSLGARSSKLSKGVISELGRVAKLLAGTTSFTCTAYTSPGKNSAKLTKSIAGSACSRLKRDKLSGRSRAVGKGSTGPIASNKTKRGQATNRRLTITFSF